MNRSIMRMSLLKWPAQGVARYLVIAVLVVVGVSVSASSAHAASSTTCTGSTTVSYSPGLTFTPRTVSYSETDTYSSCTSTDTSLTSGSFSGGTTIAGASCFSVDVSGPLGGGYTVSWNNGQSSTLSALVLTDDIIDGTEVFTGVGTVTAGEFIGGDATVVWTYPVLDPLQCLTSQGLTSQSGTVTLEIIVAP